MPRAGIVIGYWGYHRFAGWQGIAAAIAFPAIAAKTRPRKG